MFNSTSNNPNILKVAVTATFITALAFSPLAFAEEHEHGKESLDAAAGKTVTGEVVDMMCYVDHNAIGEKHGQSCRSEEHTAELQSHQDIVCRVLLGKKYVVWWLIVM